MKESGVVYLVTNTVNGKRYVGQTVNGADYRWAQHVAAAFRGDKHFLIYKAIRKYGSPAFIVEVLAEVPREYLNLVERVWIKVYDSMNPLCGYNMLPGGDFEHREKSAEHRRKLRDANLGKKHSDETKRKMSSAKLGKSKSDETKQRMKDAWKHRKPRKPLTPEQRERSRQGTIEAWARRKAALAEGMV